MRRVAGLLVIMAIVAGCAQPAGSSPVPSASLGPDELVLRVDYPPMLTAAEPLDTGLPRISVYADGRVIGWEIVPSPYPGLVLPLLDVRTIGADELQHLLGLAADAGLTRGGAIGTPPADPTPTTNSPSTPASTSTPGSTSTPASTSGPGSTSVTRYTVRVGADLVVTDVPIPPDGSTPPSVGPLQDALTAALPELNGAAAYEPTALAVFAQPWTSADDTDGPIGLGTDRAWPGPTLPGDAYGEQHCLVVTGADLAVVLPAVRQSSLLDTWTVGDQRWKLTFRQLLPDEHSCTDLS